MSPIDKNIIITACRSGIVACEEIRREVLEKIKKSKHGPSNELYWESVRLANLAIQGYYEILEDVGAA